LKIAVTLLLFLQVLCLFSFPTAKGINSIPDSYKNLRFWDSELDNCYACQDTNVSCVSASIQMVLKYLDFSPLPNQTQLANEMNTAINSTTKWKFTYIPFKNRGYIDYYNQSLSDDFSKALEFLKGNVSQNYPAILKTWYNETWKAKNITHGRVVTGYNSTGIFLHDPSDGRPNGYMNYSTLSNLWNDLGYWAFIVKQEPEFDLIVNVKDRFGNPVPDVEFTLRGKINRTNRSNSNGTMEFPNLTIGNYVLNYNWRFDSEEDELILTKPLVENYTVFCSNQTIIVIFAIIIFLVLTLLYLKKRG